MLYVYLDHPFSNNPQNQMCSIILIRTIWLVSVSFLSTRTKTWKSPGIVPIYVRHGNQGSFKAGVIFDSCFCSLGVLTYMPDASMGRSGNQTKHRTLNQTHDFIKQLFCLPFSFKILDTGCLSCALTQKLLKLQPAWLKKHPLHKPYQPK